MVQMLCKPTRHRDGRPKVVCASDTGRHVGRNLCFSQQRDGSLAQYVLIRSTAVLTTIPHAPQTDTTSPIGFFHMLERLKTNKREGWRRFQLMDGESISDHMYRMSILTMLAPPSISQKINIPHCTKMALIHDMAELLVGDITPVDNVPKHEKSRREEETMDYLCKGLLGKVYGGVNGEEIRRVWREYEDSKTPESIFVHDIDKIELLLQMVEYERSRTDEQGNPLDLDEFTFVATKIALPEMKDWAKQIIDERDTLRATIGAPPASQNRLEKEQHKRQVEAYYGKDK
jgi:putative hydrolase of HD superfamily